MPTHGLYVLLQILECFWQLASNSIEERIEAAKLLSNECEKAEKKELSEVKGKSSSDLATFRYSFESSSPLTRYCLKRLITGLSSTRESARQGFALALSGIVTMVAGKVGVSEISRYMDEVFSRKDGQDVIGHLFGIGAIVQSGACFSPEDIEYLTDHLMELSNAKSFVKEAVVEILTKLAYRIKKDNVLLKVFFSCGKLRDFLEMLPTESHAPPELLTLGINLWPVMHKEFNVVCKILPDKCILPKTDFITNNLLEEQAFSDETSRASGKFFSKDHLTSILGCLKMTTYSHPRMHSCWESMLQLLLPGYRKQEINNTANLRSIENFWNILVENNLFASNSHERKYLGMLLFKSMLPCLDESAIEILITQKFIRCLGNNVNKQTYLNRASVDSVELLADKMKKSKGRDSAKILSSIQQYCGNQLSHIFKSRGVKIEVAKSPGIPPEVLQTLSECRDGDMSQLGHISKIPGIVKRHQNVPESFEDLFKGLVDTYWRVHEDRSSEEANDAAIKIAGSLLNSFGILSRAHSNIGSLVTMEARILEHLISKREMFSPESLRNLRIHIMDHIDLGDPKKMYHFLHVVCLLELYGIINPPTCDGEMTNDLATIFKECFSPRQRGKNDHVEGIQWQDVLVDCILSVLSRNEAPYPSAPLRDSGELLFRYFSAEISKNGLSSMFEVLMESPENAAPQEAESDDEVEMDDWGNDNLPEDDKDSEREEDEDSIHSDIEADLPDATDEQMFRMDSMLGAYFASHANSKSKKSLKEDSMNFKLRVVNCLEIYMRLNSDSSLLLAAPDPLLSSLNIASRPEGSRVLRERLVGLIKNKLCKCRCRESNSSNTDSESIRMQLRKSLYLASRSPTKEVAESAAAAYIFLQRCVHHHAKHLQQVANESLEVCLTDYFTKKKSKLTKSFIPELFKKIPELAKVSLPTLAEQCISARSPYLRTEAFILLGTILQLAGSEEAKMFFNQNKDKAAKLLELSQELGSGKRKEVQKVASQIHSLIQ